MGNVRGVDYHQNRDGGLQQYSDAGVAAVAAVDASGNAVNPAKEDGNLQALATATGTPADAAWSGAGNSSLIAAMKAIWGKLAALTDGNQRSKITDGTLNASLLDGGAGGVGLLVSQGPNLFTSSGANSSVNQLAVNATFTGAIESAFLQPSTQILMTSDQPMLLTINQYIDAAGTRKSNAMSFTVDANQGFNLCMPVAGNFLNVTAKNIGAATTTTFRLDVTYGNMAAVDNYGSQSVTLNQQAYGKTNAVYVGGTGQGKVVPTITAGSAYAANNCVGGLLSFVNVVNAAAPSGVLESIALKIKSTQSVGFVLDLFEAQPATTFTDKTTAAIVAADSFLRIGSYALTNNDSGLGANSTLYTLDNVGKAITLSGTTLYGVLRVTGAATFPSAADIQVSVVILRD